MNGTMTNGNQSKGKTVLIGSLLLGSGLGLNYLFERHNILKVWENSPYPISWADAFYPPLCIFLALIGIATAVGGAISHATTRRLLRRAFTIAVPFTVLHTLFTFGIQFVATGADRLGESAGLDQAAASSTLIPESKVWPGHPAVGCSLERRGIFLAYYNDVFVYGITDAEQQQRVLDGIAEQFRQARTHPVQVNFYEKENWSVRRLEKNLGIKRPPETDSCCEHRIS